LGYIEPGKIEGMTEDERRATFDEGFEYNDHLRASGHLVAEVPLQPPETALTLYWKNGKVATTDGPYAEAKEQPPPQWAWSALNLSGVASRGASAAARGFHQCEVHAFAVRNGMASKFRLTAFRQRRSLP
jgi:hypothetical protein